MFVFYQVWCWPAAAIYILESDCRGIIAMAFDVWDKPSSSPALCLLQNWKTGPMVSGVLVDIQIKYSITWTSTASISFFFVSLFFFPHVCYLTSLHSVKLYGFNIKCLVCVYLIIFSKFAKCWQITFTRVTNSYKSYKLSNKWCMFNVRYQLKCVATLLR